MIKFKEFLIEIKFGKDFRTNKEGSFIVSYRSSKPNPNYKYEFGKKPTEPMYHPSHDFFFHDNTPKDGYLQGNSEEERNVLSHSRSSSFTVHPENKTINLEIEHYTSHQHRRPNTKLGNYNREASRVTPILYSTSTGLGALSLKKLLKDVNKVHPIHDYTITGHPEHEGKKVSDLMSEPTAHEAFHQRKPITLYHGTSTARAREIVTGGLHPGKRETTYSDLVPGYSNKNTYLARDPGEASNYATRQAIEDGSHPVILKVQIHPHEFEHIRRDEDYMHGATGDTGLHPESVRRLKEKHPVLARQHMTVGGFPAGQGIEDVHFHALTKPEIDVPTGRMIEKPWGKEPEKVKRQLTFDNPRYTGGLHPDDVPPGHTENSYRDQIGRDAVDEYKKLPVNLHKQAGIAITKSIPTNRISVFRTWKKQSIKKNFDTPEFTSTLEKMKSTVKDKL